MASYKGVTFIPRIFKFYLNLLIETTDKVVQDFNDIFRVDKITSSFTQLKFLKIVNFKIFDPNLGPKKCYKIQKYESKIYYNLCKVYFHHT